MTIQGTKANVRRRKAISGVWLVPLMALLIGAWFVYWEWQNRGFQVTVQFRVGEGLVAAKTKLRFRDIDVGEVERVSLSDDLQNVDVVLRVQKTVKNLMREDTQFWVVRPRISSGGISGLGTLLSGAYISFSAGDPALEKRSDYIGLEEPPITSSNAPGRRVQLLSAAGDSMRVGQAIHYRGFRVGKIETARFDSDLGLLRAQAFIESPYHELLSSSSRFWRTGGVGLETKGGALKLRTGSLESMLFGGVSFDIPDGVYPGKQVVDQQSFELFPDKASIEINPYQHSFNLLMLYPGTVRGLEVGASVDFRGTRVGQVEQISFDLLSESELDSVSDVVFPVPILLRLEPARLTGKDTQAQVDLAIASLKEAVRKGMRATIRQGNLLTGDHYISMEPLAQAGEEEIYEVGGYLVLPSMLSGFAQLSKTAQSALTKFEQLPLEQSVGQLNSTLLTLQRTLWRADQAIAGLTPDSPMYHDIQQTLARTRGTLQNVDQLTRTLKNRPSELLFSSPPKADPIPRKEQ